MKISELIRKLQEAKEQYGDMEYLMYNDGYFRKPLDDCFRTQLIPKECIETDHDHFRYIPIGDYIEIHI